MHTLLTFALQRRAIFASLALICLTACNATSSGPSIPAASTNALTSFSTATNTVCVNPSTTSQTVALPNTGGASGSISLGAFPAASTSCDYVKISTGNDVELALLATVTSVSEARSVSSTSTPTPILTISVGEALNNGTNQGLFDSTTVIAGIQLNISSNVNFPDGTYYAIISSPPGSLISIPPIKFVAVNGVLTVAPGTQPIVIPNSSPRLISIYAHGVIPPAPTAIPTVAPTLSPGATPTPIPSASPTAAPTPIPTSAYTPVPGITTYGQPPPPDGTDIGTYSYNWATDCPDEGNACSQVNRTVYFYNYPDTPLYVKGGMWGTITYSLGLAGDGFVQTSSSCPVDWDVSAGLGGAGSITIPQSDPFGAPNFPQCSITYSTLPPGASGAYYTLQLVVTALPG